MVPLGRHALMPGQLVHTNEVLVSLGDNWFAHCSAQQSVDIIGRRLQYVTEQLKKLASQLKDLEARANFAADINETLEGGFMEIREECPEEEQHDNLVRRSRHKIRHPKQEPCGQKDHVDVMAHLDELEKAERQSKDEQETQEQETDHLHDRSVAQCNPEVVTLPTSRINDKKQTSRSCSVITFRHTPVDQPNLSSTDVVDCDISPGNIVKLHSSTVEKLNQTEEKFSSNRHVSSRVSKHVRFADDSSSNVAENSSKPEETRAVRTSRLPFTGVIVEKQTTNSKETIGTKQPARESAFKRSRQTNDS
ncbi:unconventional prefoldin RPB5 interactor 1-like isoform X2 [Corticium candelabrum]|nr:unconventional prefoldin RPB5 interactor 1-like isoform X2 [Corticium candelabrum]XP_062504327.1 unconventional prefoldin RPB5 interactor 1-like isoform X2 [Corticium candelabrum]